MTGKQRTPPTHGLRNRAEGALCRFPLPLCNGFGEPQCMLIACLLGMSTPRTLAADDQATAPSDQRREQAILSRSRLRRRVGMREPDHLLGSAPSLTQQPWRGLAQAPAGSFATQDAGEGERAEAGFGAESISTTMSPPPGSQIRPWCPSSDTSRKVGRGELNGPRFPVLSAGVGLIE